MTSGALMTLVAYGAQDVYLTGNPQITYFKMVYRRHTNFALETIDLTLQGTADYGKKSTVTITRNGDLIANMYVRVVLQAITPTQGSQMGYVRRLGHVLLQEVEVELGGSRIDKQYGVWLDIWYDLAHHAGDGERGYAKLIGDVPQLTTYNGCTKCEYTLYIPLQFWFNRHYGLALPLIALQYHEVKLNFTFATASQCIVMNSNFRNTDLRQVAIKDASLYVKYIFLDSEERRRFAQVGHEYLIEQLQFTGEEAVTSNIGRYKLDYNHPTKELIWAMRNGNFSTGKAFPYYTHKDDWESQLEEAAKKILSESVFTQMSCCDIRKKCCSADQLAGDGSAADGGIDCDSGVEDCNQNYNKNGSGTGCGSSAARSLSTGYGGSRSTRTRRSRNIDRDADADAAACGGNAPDRGCEPDPFCCTPDKTPAELLGCAEVGDWEAFGPDPRYTKVTKNGKIHITNNSHSTILWINTSSLSIASQFLKSGTERLGSLTDKICADITLEPLDCTRANGGNATNVGPNGLSCGTGCGRSSNLVAADACCDGTAKPAEEVQILICNVSTSLTVRDLSFPIIAMKDCRVQSQVDDPLVNQLNYGLLIDHTFNPISSSILRVNGHEREQIRDGNYSNYLQPDQHHTNTPADGINVYSFALSPEEHQPSGTTNFSRIDNTLLELTFKDYSKCGEVLPDLPLFATGFANDHKLYIFAFSYNVLRVMSGMGGLAYSN
jgi:hypothetical protein